MIREVFLTVTPEELREVADHLEANPDDYCHLKYDGRNFVTFRTHA